MKKRHYLPIVLLSAILTACGGNTPKATATQDDAKPTTQDNAKTQTTTEQKPAKKQLSFLTQDLRMHNLFGKVKDIKTVNTDTDADQKPLGDPMEDWFKLEYDADGHFVKNVSENAQKGDVKQKDGDKIIRTETPIEDFGGIPVIVEYTYDADGLVKTKNVQGIESKSSVEYTYNADGELVKEIEKGSGEGSIFEDETTYTILERDSNKNWTKRFAKKTFKEGPDDGSGKLEPYGDPSYQLQTRTINYW